MEISGIEKFSRYFALTALVVAATLTGLVYFKIVKIPGTGTPVESKASAGATPRPSRSPAGKDDSAAVVSGSEAPRESGSFQSGPVDKPQS